MRSYNIAYADFETETFTNTKNEIDSRIGCWGFYFKDQFY
jgi:hypothetical protein